MNPRALALAAVILAAVLDLIDGTVVNVALPSIQRDLDAGNAAAGWIGVGYPLALAALLTVGGRLGDRFGHRRTLTLATAGFLLASLACASAPSAAMLVLARLLQGIAGAAMVPQTLALIQLLYPPDRRGRAIAIFAAVAGTATVGGPLLGALILQTDPFGLGWRAIFWLNLPAGLFVLLGTRLLPESAPARREPLGLGSAGLLAIGLVLLTYPLLRGSELGWPAWVWPPLILAAGVLATFARREHVRSRAGRPVLVDTALFGYGGFTGAVATLLVVYAVVFGLFFTMTLHLQGALGWSPMRLGLAILPWAVGIPLANVPAVRWLVPRFGRRVAGVGGVLLSLGLAMLASTVTCSSGSLDEWSLAPGLFVAGVGMGLVIAPTLTLGLGDVPAGLSGLASGVINNVQQLAGTLGIAAIGAVYLAGTGAGPTNPERSAAAFGSVAWTLVVLATCALPFVRLLPAKVPAKEPAGTRPVSR